MAPPRIRQEVLLKRRAYKGWCRTVSREANDAGLVREEPTLTGLADVGRHGADRVGLETRATTNGWCRRRAGVREYVAALARRSRCTSKDWVNQFRQRAGRSNVCRTAHDGHARRILHAPARVIVHR